MYGVGHLAIGYLLGLAASRVFKVDLNVPAVLVLSVLPDADILVPQLLHRGPVHSLVAACLVFTPFFLFYRSRAAPYFAAFASHSLVGDFISGGRVQLFWPLSTGFFGVEMSIRSPVNVALEWLFFAVSLLVMFRAGHLATLFEQRRSNLLLLVPVLTVLLPTLLSFPLGVPVWLVLPHLIYVAVFTASIAFAVFGFLKKIVSGGT